uniref:Uncharacterized protein n=1 Tax=Leersia perrieri TaxID=77586 RepID=A0A0D9V2Q3_9ORYZ
MADLLSKASSAVAACARRVSRATRRLLHKRLLRRCGGGGGVETGKPDVVGEGLWRRAILMGERCEPLSFPGAIHYDSLGRRLSQPRRGRQQAKPAGAAAMLCRSSDAVEEAVVSAAAANGSSKARYVAAVPLLRD